jgi:hypothetical protein
VWKAITTASLTTPIDTVRTMPDGITCSVLAHITLSQRTARVRIVRHYANEWSALRLVTAYPSL